MSHVTARFTGTEFTHGALLLVDNHVRKKVISVSPFLQSNITVNVMGPQEYIQARVYTISLRDEIEWTDCTIVNPQKLSTDEFTEG